MKLSNVDQWCVGKPLMLAGFARQAATQGVQVVLGLLEWSRKGGAVPGQAVALDARQWVRLYRQHRRIQRVVLEALPPFGQSSELSPDVLLGVSEVLQAAGSPDFQAAVQAELAKLSPADLAAGLKDGQKLTREFFADDSAGQDLDDRTIEAAMKLPEVLFFFRVWLPCLMEYGRSPTRLMRQARQGNIAAIEKLLRLDKSAVHDPVIARLWQRAGENRGHGLFKRLHRALGDAPDSKLDPRAAKLLMASLVEYFADDLARRLKRLPDDARRLVAPARRLKAPEIRDLFDAVARDAGGLADADLPDSPEAFYKELYRLRGFWKLLPPPGQK